MPFDPKKYDAKAFIDGTWEEFDGGLFKIAKAGNPQHQDARKRIPREYEQKHGKDLTPELEEKMNAEIIAHGLLLDWQDVGVDEPVPYTKQNAATVLREYPPLANFVVIKANDVSRFEREKIEEAVEKQSASSSGAKTGKGRGKASSTHTASTSE